MTDELPTPPEKETKRKLPKALKVVARVMHDRGMSDNKIAEELEVGKGTVQRAVADPNLDRNMVSKVNETLDMIVSTKLGDIILKLAEHLNDPTAIKKLGPYQTALTLGILVDKKRLLDGQSTENISVNKALTLQITDELARLKDMKTRLLEGING